MYIDDDLTRALNFIFGVIPLCFIFTMGIIIFIKLLLDWILL